MAERARALPARTLLTSEVVVLGVGRPVLATTGTAHTPVASSGARAAARPRAGLGSRIAGWVRDDRPRALLILVCLIHTISPLLLVGVHFWFEWDETVYISQVSVHAPAGLFTAPRARGLTVLLAPVTLLTASTVALRVYLAVLSGVGMFVAFRLWLRLRPGYVVPVAALFFSTLWTTIYYGFEAQPNLYVALAALPAVARLLLAQREPDRVRHVVWLGFWLAVVALIRPLDSLYLAAPLAIAVLVLPGFARRQRVVLLVAIGAGLAAGWLEWIIEAFVSYGGLLARLHAASAENHGGVHFSLGLQARGISGPTLCRDRCHPPPVPWRELLWWFAIPVLTALGVAAAVRRRAAALMVVPTVAAIALAAEYIVTVDYGAPRFLMPAYALFSLPCAEGAAWLCRAADGRVRTGVVAAIAVLLAGHTAVQVHVLESKIVPANTASRLQYLDVARDLRRHGVRPDCLVVGYFAAPIAFAAGCTDVPNHRPGITAKARDGHTTVAMLTVRPAKASAYYASWPSYRLHGRHLRHRWYAYIAQPKPAPPSR